MSNTIKKNSKYQYQVKKDRRTKRCSRVQVGKVMNDMYDDIRFIKQCGSDAMSQQFIENNVKKDIVKAYRKHKELFVNI